MKKLYLENIDHECAIDDAELKFMNFIYADGKLEDENGFDLLRESKADHFDRRKNINGEDCIAVLASGKEVPAKLFAWHVVYSHTYKLWNGDKYRQTITERKGLLVAKDDAESIRRAQKFFDERRREL